MNELGVVNVGEPFEHLDERAEALPKQRLPNPRYTKLVFSPTWKPCIYGACHSITEALYGTQPTWRIG